MFTYAQYMNKECSHDEYYIQFEEAVKWPVDTSFTIEDLVMSYKEDNRFNTWTTPLRKWDSLVNGCKSNYSYIYAKLNDGKRLYSIAGIVCASKAYARKKVLNHLKKQELK